MTHHNPSTTLSPMRPRRCATVGLLALALTALLTPAAQAAPGDQPVPAVPAAKLGNDKARVRNASLPGSGLFVGDQLSQSAKARLTDLLIDTLGLRVEVALIVPVGPWVIDGATHTDRDLTTARLNAVRRFLTERGIDPKHIFVESQIDAKVKEPRLDVQLLGSPAND